MNQINGTPALQSPDGATASELIPQNTNAYAFLVYAGSPGWQAAQIQTIFTGSADLDPIPTGTNALEDNLRDLQPRVHIYLASGAGSLPVRFSLDTTKFADGFHDLTAVAYEGTSVRTQTRVGETVQFRNTSLSPTLSVSAAGEQTEISCLVLTQKSQPISRGSSCSAQADHLPWRPIRRRQNLPRRPPHWALGCILFLPS